MDPTHEVALDRSFKLTNVRSLAMRSARTSTNDPCPLIVYARLGISAHQ